MTRKHFSEVDILGVLRQIELELATGSTVELASLFSTTASSQQ
jgi:hypothetical protein